MSEANNQQQPMVEIQDLDQFVRVLVAWHTAQVGRTQQLLAVPEGTAFTVGEGEEAKDVILSGDTLAGFKFGVEMALMQLGQLPFVAQTEDAPEASKLN